MGLLKKLFGAPAPREPEETAEESPLCFKLLLERQAPLSPQALVDSLAAFDPLLAEGQVERFENDAFVVTWDGGAVRLHSVASPMDPAALDRCLLSPHLDERWKARARIHEAHVILQSAAVDTTAPEQLAALSAIARALLTDNVIAVINETAPNAAPASLLRTADSLAALSDLPLPALFVGFRALTASGQPWTRTTGAALLGLPDLAMRAQGTQALARAFNTVSDVYRYIAGGLSTSTHYDPVARASYGTAATFSAGDTIEVEGGTWIVREPEPEEDFLESDGTMLVLEPI